MANRGGPATGNSQLYFNLENDTTALGPSNNGGFTVFGKIVGSNDQQTLDALTATTGTNPPVVVNAEPEPNNLKPTNPSNPFGTVPMKGGYPANNANFAKDATASNFDL